MTSSPANSPLVLAPPSFWRPPGWIPTTRVDVKALGKIKGANAPDADVLADLVHPYEPASHEVDGRKVRGVIELEKYFDAQSFYSRGKHALIEEVDGEPLAPVALEVLTNAKLLRDAWNTAGSVWRMIRRWIEPHKITVDPFSNSGTLELPDLLIRLDGSSVELDGFANDGGFPRYWRGGIEPGCAGAGVNGPHSVVESWLRLCAAYGREEICAAFVPDAADVWWFDALTSAALVFRFGRVRCSPPPGITPSSPRGTSAVILWIPPTLDVLSLPEHTQRALAGENFTVPYDTIKGKKGRRNLVCTVSAARHTTLDLGFGVPAQTVAPISDVAQAETPAANEDDAAETPNAKPRRTRAKKSVAA